MPLSTGFAYTYIISSSCSTTRCIYPKEMCAHVHEANVHWNIIYSSPKLRTHKVQNHYKQKQIHSNNGNYTKINMGKLNLIILSERRHRKVCLTLWFSKIGNTNYYLRSQIGNFLREKKDNVDGRTRRGVWSVSNACSSWPV